MTRRLLVVARRFWPFCDESCHRLVHWSSHLQRQGIEVTVLTSRGHASWPAESDCREVRVIRLLPAPKSSWTETLFLRNVATWITKHRQEFDVIYVDESRSLLHQIGSRSVHGEIPLISRFGGISQTLVSGTHALSVISHSVDACRRADFVVAPNAMAHRQLQSSGIPVDRIARIPDVAWTVIHPEPESRKLAASALRQVNQDMSIPSDAKLMIYIGELDQHANLQALVRAAMAKLKDDWNFRLWLVGDGAALRGLYDFVKDAAYHHDILFHCPFDGIEELFHVADAIVCPQAGAGEDYILPTAIAAGIPIIALDSSPIRNNIPTVLHTSLLKEPNQRNFESAIEDWCDNTKAWKQRAEIARREWIASHFIENAVTLWLDLLSRSVQELRSSASGS